VVDSHILLDPSSDEEKSAQADIMVAMMPSANEITQMVQTGEMHHAKAPEAPFSPPPAICLSSHPLF